MAKRRRTNARRTKPEKRGTNWLVIGGVVVGVVLIFGLLFLALQEPETPSLVEFCQANPDNCLSQGDENAPVTVVEVSDYSCSHCRDFNRDSAASIENAYVLSGQVRWLTIPYALSSQTVPAAESAYCANEQDSFFAYHKQMFANQDQPMALTPGGYLLSAGQAGLDLEMFNSCLEADNYGSLVQENLAAASNVGVRSTPTFFINEVKIEGNNPSGIIEAIEAELGS